MGELPGALLVNPNCSISREPVADRHRDGAVSGVSGQEILRFERQDSTQIAYNGENDVFSTIAERSHRCDLYVVSKKRQMIESI